MIKGIFRLLIVAFLVSWVSMFIVEWRSWADSQPFLIDNNVELFSISPDGSKRINASSWFVYAAQESFIESSRKKRIDLAREYYQDHIEPIQDYYFLGHEDRDVKSWIERTAKLSLEEAPRLIYTDSNGYEVYYRQFNRPFFNIGPRITYLVKSGNVWLNAFILAVLLTIAALVLILVVKWVYRGFVPKMVR
jgi:hypothetical protein